MDGGGAGGAGGADPISMGIQAAGNIAQGIGGFAAGQANAKLDKRNAQGALEDAVGSELQTANKARQVMGEQIAEQGTAGFQLGTGSNFDALQNSSLNKQLDLMNIRRTAQSKADAYTYQAGLDKMKGNAALASGLFGAAGALSKGFSDAAYQKQLASGGASSVGSSPWGASGWDSAPDDTVNYGGM